MSQLLEFILKMSVCGAGVFLLLALLHRRQGLIAQNYRRTLQILTVVGALSYVNFGGLHTDGTPWHLWDQYHYFVGSKYFPELKYDGLYVATIAARAEQHPTAPQPKRVRDLRNGRLVDLDSVQEHSAEVRSRFSEARWAKFRTDVSHFYLQPDIFLDNGLKATPAHVQVLRLFSSWLPFRTMGLALAGSLDFLLLGLTGLVVYRAFGLATLASMSLMFGLGFCSRFYWLGGAFLRHDWFSALVIAAGMLRLGHWRTSAVALAYASAVRIFPILFIVPLGIYALAKLRRGEDVREWVEYLVVFLLTATAFIGVGYLAEPEAWSQSIAGLLTHSRTTFPISIGLRVPFITSVANLRGDLVSPETLYDYVAISKDYSNLLAERSVVVAVATLGFVCLTLRAAWRAPNPVVAFALGVPLVFALTAPTCYYGTFLVLLVLVDPLRTCARFLGAAFLCYALGGVVLALSRVGYFTLNGAAIFGPVSVILAVFILVELVRFPSKEEPALDAS